MVPVTCDTSLKFVYDSALGGGGLACRTSHWATGLQAPKAPRDSRRCGRAREGRGVRRVFDKLAYLLFRVELRQVKSIQKH